MIAAKWLRGGQVSLTDCLEVACKAWYECEVGCRRQEAPAEPERLGDQGAGRDLGHWSGGYLIILGLSAKEAGEFLGSLTQPLM